MRFWGTLLIYMICAQAQALTWTEAESRFLETNKELRALEMQMQAQRNKTNADRSLFLPEIDAKAGYQKEKTIHDNDEGYVGYLEGRWNLFSAGASYYRYKISQLSEEAIKLETGLHRKKLRRQLAEVYYGIWIQQQSLDLWKQKQSLLNQQRSMAAKKINAGLSSQVDALEIDLEENMAEAEVESFKHESERLWTELQALVPGLSTQTNIQKPTPIPFPQESAQTLTTKSTATKINSLTEEIARLERNEKGSTFLPRIDLEAQYGRIIPKFDNPVEGTETQVALLMTWSLFSGGKKWNDFKSSRNLQEAKALSNSQENLNIYSQINKLLSLKTEKDHLHELLRKKEKLTQSYYDLTLSEYRRGIKNSADLASATHSLFETKQKLITIEAEIELLGYKIDELI